MSRMNTSYRSIIICLAIVFLVVGAALGQTSQTPVVQVGSKTITWGDVAQRAAEKFGAQVVDELVAESLIDQAAAAKGITVTDAEIDKRIEEMKANIPAGTTLEEALKASGVTKLMLKHNVKTTISVEKVLAIKVTPEEAKTYFETNKKQFDQPARAKMSAIVVSDEPAAQAAYARLKKGESFGAVSAEVSKYDELKSSHGQIGWITKGSGADPKVEEVAFSTKLRTYSEPFKSGGDYYILYVEEEVPGKEATLADSQSGAAYALRTYKLNTELAKWLPAQREKLKPKVLMKFE